jgi:hypothetical protein
MRFLLIAILIHALGFSLFFNNRQIVTGDPKLVSLAVTILSDIKAQGADIPSFYSLQLVFEEEVKKPDKYGNITIGFTQYYTTPIPLITINRAIWNKFSADRRYMLVLHEIGHAIWRRDHDDMILPNFIPRSIMTTNIFNVDTFRANKVYYVRELFSKSGEI